MCFKETQRPEAIASQVKQGCYYGHKGLLKRCTINRGEKIKRIKQKMMMQKLITGIAGVSVSDKKSEVVLESCSILHAFFQMVHNFDCGLLGALNDTVETHCHVVISR